MGQSAYLHVETVGSITLRRRAHTPAQPRLPAELTLRSAIPERWRHLSPTHGRMHTRRRSLRRSRARTAQSPQLRHEPFSHLLDGCESVGEKWVGANIGRLWRWARCVQAGRNRAGAIQGSAGADTHQDVKTAGTSKMEIELLRPPTERAAAAAPIEPFRSLRARHPAARPSCKQLAPVGVALDRGVEQLESTPIRAERRGVGGVRTSKQRAGALRQASGRWRSPVSASRRRRSLYTCHLRYLLESPLRARCTSPGRRQPLPSASDAASRCTPGPDAPGRRPTR
jgi:hypothetical protein